MTFLIAKIFIYLIVAGAVGFGAGWLLRNLQAQKHTEASSRAMHDAKSKLPQLESLLRGRDEQLQRTRDELVELKNQSKERAEQLKQAQHELREQTAEAERLKASAQARTGGSEMNLEDTLQEGDDIMAMDGGSDVDDLIAELSQEIVQLKTELRKKDAELRRASTAGAAVDDAELEAMRLQLKRLDQDLKNTRADLIRANESVQELERERELQNKSLQVLHQQLELERTRRVASG